MRSLARIAVCFAALFALVVGAAVAADLSLDVPYLSQFWAATSTLPASQANGNCAPTAVEMAAAYAQGRQPTPENIVELNKLMGRKDPIKGGPTRHREVCEAGKQLYKLPVEFKKMSLTDALNEVAAGGPVVVGIIYGDISTRWDKHCTGGHTLVLVGADENSVILNDPDDKTPDHKGKAIHYSRAEFEKAMNDFGGDCLVGFRKLASTAGALSVPFLSQFWTATPKLAESLHNFNCGPASIEMCAAYAQSRQPTPENIVELNKLMGRKDPIKGAMTGYQELAAAAKALYKLPVQFKKMSLDDALKEVAAGGPVMVGILYKDISTRKDQKFIWGHFVTLIGADEKTVIVNDPDDKTPNHQGANVHYDRAEFEKAMKDLSRGCIIGFRRPPTPPAPVTVRSG